MYAVFSRNNNRFSGSFSLLTKEWEAKETRCLLYKGEKETQGKFLSFLKT